MADIGLSFGPGNGGSGGYRGGASTPNTSTQDAIQVLRFRLPSIVGAAAPAAPQFMQGPTAQGAQIGGGIAEQFLRALFGGQGFLNQSQNPLANLGFGMSGEGQSGGGGGLAGQSAGLPVSIGFGERGGLSGNIENPMSAINDSMPPSPTNPATGNQFVDFNRPNGAMGSGNMMDNKRY